MNRSGLTPEPIFRTDSTKIVMVEINQLPYHIPTELYMDEEGVIIENSNKQTSNGENWGVRIYETETSISTLYKRYQQSIQSLEWGPLKELRSSHDGDVVLTVSQGYDSLMIIIGRSVNGKKSRVEVVLTSRR